MLKVGFVDYINSFPLNAAFRLQQISSSAELTYAIPSTLNGLLREGKLDLSFVSSVEYLEGDYTYLPYGIIAPKHILSVNLYVQKLHETQVVALTHHSATSVSLLKLLCKHFWKIKPRFISLDRKKNLTDYPSFLLIGDEALNKRQIPGYTTIDLAESWHQMTGLPFVFALFAVRREIMDRKKQEVEAFHSELQSAYCWGQNNSAQLETLAHKSTGLPLKLIRQYFSLCHYPFGEQEQKGLAAFAKLRHE